MSSPPPRRFDPCAKNRGGERAGEWRGLDMHIKLLTWIPRDRAGNLQPAEFLFFFPWLAQVRLFSSHWHVYSYKLTMQLIGFTLHSWHQMCRVASVEMNRTAVWVSVRNKACIRRWMTHKYHICFWFEAMTMWISITSISYNGAKLMEKISLEDIYKAVRLCTRSTFSFT